ncbi:MAG: transposase [Rhodocyclaceae bacterium]|nr:transposase [Rhodocyclaceae bacterium]
MPRRTISPACLHWLGEALEEAHCALHAHALMTNHVHLLLTPRKAEAVPRLSSHWGGATCSTSTPPIDAPARCGAAATSLR